MKLKKTIAAVVLGASCTSAQADVLTEASNLGYIAEELRLQLEQGYKFAIGVTEGIHQQEFAATHAEQEYHIRTDQVIAFEDAYTSLVQAESAVAEEYLDYQICIAEVNLRESIDAFVEAAVVITAVVEVAAEANTVTTEQEAVAIQAYISDEGLGTITTEMSASYNTALTEITDYSRDVSILSSVRNNTEFTDYLNYEIETYGLNPYEGVLTITAAYDVLIDMSDYGLGISGSSFFNSEKENDMFVAMGGSMYDEMFGEP
jgi:hypothetical protein